MHIGALLVIVGVILCVLATVIDRAHRDALTSGPVVALGAALIGIGVLVGHTALTT